jgi:2-dehydro-3-deoxyphosphogluconate aldolase/(4S)-4-hydroxy-2-oxoglutarate aldolase
MLTPTQVMQISPIIPVIAIDDADKAVNLANALIEGGIRILEITLRTAAALDAIERIATQCSNAVVGAGTVLNQEDLKRVNDAGAQFSISPGMTVSLLQSAKTMNVTFLPGVASASDIMLGLEHGYDRFKLFPAVSAGGITALKSFSGPFGNVKFCPTGGVNADNAADFLALDNVLCVGGSWVAPSHLIDNDDYWQITKITRNAIETIKAFSK